MVVLTGRETMLTKLEILTKYTLVLRTFYRFIIQTMAAVRLFMNEKLLFKII
jgi:hypothetical protein